jgi:hypothetical protein
MTSIDFPDWNLSAPAAGVGWQQTFSPVVVNTGNLVYSATFYVGNFDTVVIKMTQSVAQAGIWSANWSTSPTGFVSAIWADTFYKDTTGTVTTALSVKAPYLFFSVFNSGGANMQVSGYVNGTKGGAAPGDAIMPQVIQDAGPVNVGGGATSTVAVPASISGPATLWGFSGVTGVVVLQRWNGTQWNYVGQVNSNQTGGGALELTVPPDDVRLQLTNTSAGAGNFYYSLTHGG